MLFNNYSQIVYKIGGKEVTLADIFRHIIFIDVDTSLAFDDYYIQDGEPPEAVSLKIYGTTNLSWLIMMVNGFNSLKADWFPSESEYKRSLDANFGGDAFYVSALPDIQPGDILVKVTGFTGASMETASGVTLSAYRHIANFDPYFRKIRGISGSGTFSSGDNILFARRDTNTGVVNVIEFNSYHSKPIATNHTEVVYTEPYQNSVEYFYTGGNVVIDPYRYSVSGSTGIKSNTLYLDESDVLTSNNFARCILYKYGACGGSVSGLIKKSVGEENFNKYIRKQKIKILKPEYLTSVLTVIENTIQSNEIGKVIKIVTNA
jgi:hypothetical protein